MEIIDELKKRSMNEEIIVSGIEALCRFSHERSVESGWWHDESGNWKERNRGEMIALIHSEISEAMEGERKNLMDDKLPHRPMPEVEMADAIIRIADYCQALGYDLAGAIVEKMEYNKTRADHKVEHRYSGKAGAKAW